MDDTFAFLAWTFGRVRFSSITREKDGICQFQTRLPEAMPSTISLVEEQPDQHWGAGEGHALWVTISVRLPPLLLSQRLDPYIA